MRLALAFAVVALLAFIASAQQAPDFFRVKYETTAGDIYLNITVSRCDSYNALIRSVAAGAFSSGRGPILVRRLSLGFSLSPTRRQRAGSRQLLRHR